MTAPQPLFPFPWHAEFRASGPGAEFNSPRREVYGVVAANGQTVATVTASAGEAERKAFAIIAAGAVAARV